MSEITNRLRRWQDGSEESGDVAFGMLYSELERIARIRTRAGARLDHREVINEVYPKLVSKRREWEDRDHFLSVAAELMKLVLVQDARDARALKRGGDTVVVPWSSGKVVADGVQSDTLTANDVIEVLEKSEPQAAQVVILRFFGGYTIAETARILGIADWEVNVLFRTARAMLIESR